MSRELNDKIVPLDRVYVLKCNEYGYETNDIYGKKIYGSNVIFVLKQDKIMERIFNLPIEGESVILTGEHAGKIVKDSVFKDMRDVACYRVNVGDNSWVADELAVREPGYGTEYNTLYRARIVEFPSVKTEKAFCGAKYVKVGALRALADELNRELFENATSRQDIGMYHQVKEDMSELFDKN